MVLVVVLVALIAVADDSLLPPGCTAELAAYGCSPSAGTTQCDDCAKQHEAKLKKAGCTVAAVAAFCKNSTTPTPAPGPASSMIWQSFQGGVTDGVLCTDGSQGGYYFQHASTPADADKWVFAFEGGGNPSSEHFPTTAPQPLGLTPAQATTWNFVFFKTCTADFHSGANLHPVTSNGTITYYQGHLHVVKALRELKAQLAHASQVLVTGASGGGWAQLGNADYIAEQMPAGCDVKAFINSGLHFDVVNWPDFIKGNMTAQPLIDKDNAENVLNAFVDESCRAALGDDWYKCIGFDHVYPYIATENYVAQSMFDAVQIGERVGMPSGVLPSDTSKWSTQAKSYVAYFGNLTLQLFVPLVRNNPKAALFVPSCHDHTAATKTTAPENVTMSPGQSMSASEAFQTWYDKGASALPQRMLVDDCATKSELPCNARADASHGYSCIHHH